MKSQRFLLSIVFEEFFQFALLTYIILILLETLKQGFVSFFFNINILLFLVLASGVVMVLTRTKDIDTPQPKKRNLSADIQNSIIFGVLGGLIVFLKTQSMGQVSLVISIFTMVLIVFLSLIVLTDKPSAKEESTKISPDLNVYETNLNTNTNVEEQKIPVVYENPVILKSKNDLKIAIETSEALKKQFENTNLWHMFVEKIQPFDKLIQDTLHTLSDNVEDSERERLEKLVEIYKQNMHARAIQLTSYLQ